MRRDHRPYLVKKAYLKLQEFYTEHFLRPQFESLGRLGDGQAGLFYVEGFQAEAVQQDVIWQVYGQVVQACQIVVPQREDKTQVKVTL